MAQQHDADLAEVARDQKIVRARPAMPKSASTVEIATATTRKAAADKSAQDARSALARPAPEAPAAVSMSTSPTITIAAPVKVATATPPAVNETDRLRQWRAGVAPPMTRQGGVRDVRGNVRPLGGHFMTDVPAPFIGPLRRPAAVDTRPYSARMAAHFRAIAE